MGKLVDNILTLGAPPGAFCRPGEAVPVAKELEFLLKAPTGAGRRRVGTALTAVVGHVLLLAVALLIPLLYTEMPRVSQLSETWLVAPPPSPPPPPAARKAASPRQRSLPPRLSKPVLEMPTSRVVARAAPAQEIAGGDGAPEVGEVYGVAGGVPGGVPEGVIGGVLGGMPSALPPPPVRAPTGPVRVGGNVRAPRLLERVAPIYPRLAQQARIQGDVRIDATIDPRGRVVEMKVLAGNPLLVKAALAALEQWLYEPVYLNGQPVVLLLEVTIHFELG